MKALNKILYVLTVVFGLASLALMFFVPFAKIVTEGETQSFVAAQLAFGAEKLTTSGHILFCFVLTALNFLLAAFSIKSKKVRYCVPVIAAIDSVYFFVIRFARNFIDASGLKDVTKISYTPFVLILAIVLAVLAVVSAAYLFLDDYLEVLASKGEKLTIFKRIVRFFRDYKSEVKKITWPGLKEVLKNTVIVLIMCLLVGALIWLVDFGLAKLLDLILGV